MSTNRREQLLHAAVEDLAPLSVGVEGRNEWAWWSKRKRETLKVGKVTVRRRAIFRSAAKRIKLLGELSGSLRPIWTAISTTSQMGVMGRRPFLSVRKRECDRCRGGWRKQLDIVQKWCHYLQLGAEGSCSEHFIDESLQHYNTGGLVINSKSKFV